MPVNEIKPINLRTFLPYQLVFLASRIERETTAIARDRCGLSSSQWRVIAAIADKPGRTAKQVVMMTPMDKGIVSRAVKSLIEMGLLTREGSQNDGRVGHLFLTNKGETTYCQLADDMRQVESRVAATLSNQDRKTLLTTIEAMTASLSS